MKKKLVKLAVRIRKLFIYSFSILFSGLILIFFFESILRLYYKDKISPNVFMLGINVSGYGEEEFTNFLKNNYKDFDKLTIVIEDSKYQVVFSDINFSIDYQNNWEIVHQLNKPYLSNPFTSSIPIFFKPANFIPLATYDKQIVLTELEKITSISSMKPTFEMIALSDSSMVVLPGKDGLVINEEQLKESVFDAIQNKSPVVSVPLEPIKSSIPEDQKESLLIAANNLIGKKILISLDDDSYEITDKDLVETLNDRAENKFEYISTLSEKITSLFNREPKNPVFVFENGKVTEFAPSQDGIIVDKNFLKNEIINKRDELSKTELKEIGIPLPHQRTQPEITTGDINNLGINEKIGMGYSTFKGSITSRIHNIKLASSKFNGVLIAPGETMSFNKTLGDVSKVTGYQQAYIIKDGQTILGDGGGVCQVSTTLFRAALNAGLPIIERRSHSYRVAYYEQGFPPGLDATVFDPTSDLKIKNDTNKHILIQTIFNEKDKKLTFDLYGTSDGRVATIGKSIIKESTPPPEDLYIDDPTLKIGVVKQIDYKAWGAKVYFNYKVEKGGLVIYEKIFYSNYQSWQAKFLRGSAS